MLSTWTDFTDFTPPWNILPTWLIFGRLIRREIVPVPMDAGKR